MDLQGGLEILQKLYAYNIVKFLVAILFTIIAIRLIKHFIHRFFAKTEFIEERKEETIESMINSIIKYIASIGLITYGISLFFVEDITGILAGAGVIGIVIGFGAQSLIKDFLSGIFLLYEKQLHQGDFVKINDKFTGTVEEIGLRVLKVREWSGKLLTISNGSIKEIQNYNIEKMRVIEHVVVSFIEEPEKIIGYLEVVCKELNEKYEGELKRNDSGEIIEPFQVYGMTSLNANHHGYQYTVVGLVKDEVYWTMAKEVRKEIATKLHKEKVKMAEENVRYQARMHV